MVAVLLLLVVFHCGWYTTARAQSKQRARCRVSKHTLCYVCAFEHDDALELVCHDAGVRQLHARQRARSALVRRVNI